MKVINIFTGNEETSGMHVLVGTRRTGYSLKNNQEGKDEILGIGYRNKVFQKTGIQRCQKTVLFLEGCFLIAM